MMGVGASLAGGCTVGNGMVETSLFSYQGWVALLFIAVGIGVGAKFWLKPATAKTVKTPQTRPAGISANNATSSAPASGSMQTATGLISLRSPTQVDDKARHLGGGYFALDSLGAVCPFPLIEAKDVMADLESGQHLVIDFDCTQGTETIPQWAVDEGHEVTAFHDTGEAAWQITIEKG